MCAAPATWIANASRSPPTTAPSDRRTTSDGSASARLGHVVGQAQDLVAVATSSRAPARQRRHRLRLVAGRSDGVQLRQRRAVGAGPQVGDEPDPAVGQEPGRGGEPRARREPLRAGPAAARGARGRATAAGRRCRRRASRAGRSRARSARPWARSPTCRCDVSSCAQTASQRPSGLQASAVAPRWKLTSGGAARHRRPAPARPGRHPSRGWSRKATDAPSGADARRVVEVPARRQRPRPATVPRHRPTAGARSRRRWRRRATSVDDELAVGR